MQVVLVQLAVHAPRTLLGRDRILLLPAAAGVLVEISARVDGLIHGGEVETRRVGKRRFLRVRLRCLRSGRKRKRYSNQAGTYCAQQSHSHLHRWDFESDQRQIMVTAQTGFSNVKEKSGLVPLRLYAVMIDARRSCFAAYEPLHSPSPPSRCAHVDVVDSSVRAHPAGSGLHRSAARSGIAERFWRRQPADRGRDLSCRRDFQTGGGIARHRRLRWLEQAPDLIWW